MQCILYFVFEANSKCILYFVFKYKINCIYVFQIHINKFKYLCAIFMTFTFVSGILGTVINVCRGLLTLKSKEKLIFDLKRHLASAQYVCTTADAWSTRGRGYLGVTAHWMTNESMIRHSAALACRRLRGAHTYDVLAESLNDVYTEYNLSTSKMGVCVTDNGSNCTKAFREFGIVMNQHSGDDSSDDDDGEDFADVTFESVDQILNEDTRDTAPAIILPPHHPCFSHTLSLLAVTDIPKILAENAALKRIHNSVMAKCSSLWNSAGLSLKSYEAIERIAHPTLVRPCPTRWTLRTMR